MPAAVKKADFFTTVSRLVDCICLTIPFYRSNLLPLDRTRPVLALQFRRPARRAR